MTIRYQVPMVVAVLAGAGVGARAQEVAALEPRAGILDSVPPAGFWISDGQEVGEGRARSAEALLVPGARVRVKTEAQRGWLKGTLLAIDERAIALSVGKDQRHVTIDRAAITKWAVRGGRASRMTGAATGAALGAGIGAGIGLALGDDDDSQGLVRFTGGEKAVTLAIVFAAPGMLLGALSPPPERWNDLPPPVRVGVSFAPVRGGAAVSLRLAF